jgi:predicted RNase H-like nuclease (RuvC/YqgF family)
MTFNWTWLNEEGADGGDAGADAAAAAAANAGDDNKGKVSDAEAKLLKEVMEKKQAVKDAQAKAQALEAEKTELAGKLAAFDGIDLEQVKALLKEKTERETAELERKGEWDRLKAQMVEAHNKELTTVRTEYEARVRDLEGNLGKTGKEIHELTIGRSFSESPFIREGLTLTPSKARVIYGSHFELQDGKVIAYDKPVGSTDRTMLIDGDGNPLAFDKAMEKLVELDPDRDNLLRSKVRSGAGSENDADARRGDGAKKELTGLARIKASIASGQLPKLPK